jgi:hypothetical protein
MIFPLASVSGPALKPTQPPVQWVPMVRSPGLKRGRGVTQTTHLHLVPMLRISRSYTCCPPSAFVACSGTTLALKVNTCLYIYIYMYVCVCVCVCVDYLELACGVVPLADYTPVDFQQWKKNRDIIYCSKHVTPKCNS